MADGPQWLTRRDDVVAHLFYAAAEIGAAELELGNRREPGSLSFPSPDTGTFSFFANESENDHVAPEVGKVVRLLYGREDAHYSFLTEVVEVAAGNRWRLSFPRTIERNQQRLVERHRVVSLGGYRTRLDMGSDGWLSLPLYDLSAGGLSFVFDPEQYAIQTGNALAGSLIIPSGSRIPILVEVRHIRTAPNVTAKKLCGCRFVGLAASDHATLARSLAEWRQRRT